MAAGNPWIEWVEANNRPTIHSTQKLSKVDRIALETREWIRPHRFDVREWCELLLMRIMSIMVIIFMLALVNAALPRPEIECSRIVDERLLDCNGGQ